MNVWVSEHPDCLLWQLYSSQNIIQVKNEIGRACCNMGIGEVYTGFWLGDLRDGDHLEDSGIDGKILLKWNFRKWVGGHGLE